MGVDKIFMGSRFDSVSKFRERNIIVFQNLSNCFKRFQILKIIVSFREQNILNDYNSNFASILI